MRLPEILSPPVLRSDSESERSASWLELFFDLVFVVAIAQLAIVISDDLSFGGFLRFLLLFVPIWWSWAGYTNYSDRFDTDDPIFRAMMLVGMLGIAALAISVPDAFRGGSEAFAISYIVVRIVLVLLYERARRNVPSARALITVTMSVFVFGISLWIVSLFVPEPWRFGFWAAALVIEGATPWVARRAMSGTPVHASHLAERYGLFTIIVLGESLVAIVLGIGTTDWGFVPAVVAACGFLVAACLWWVYFDFIELVDIQRGLVSRNVFIYGHLLIAIGLTCAGVGVKKAITYSSEAHFTVGGSWLLCGGTALFITGISLIYAISSQPVRLRILLARIVAIFAALGLAFIGATFLPITVVGSMLLILIALVAWEMFEKSTEPEPEG